MIWYADRGVATSKGARAPIDSPEEPTKTSVTVRGMNFSVYHSPLYVYSVTLISLMRAGVTNQAK